MNNEFDFLFDLNKITNIKRITQIGSSVLPDLAKFSSDIDLVVHLSRWNPTDIICFLSKSSFDFYTKKPSMISDLKSERIEFYIKRGGNLYDITLLPDIIKSISYVEEASRNFFDIEIGNLFIYGKVIFGDLEIGGYKKENFFPFYNENIVKDRLDNLDWKIDKVRNKVIGTLQKSDIGLITQLRDLKIRRLFIEHRKYPLSYEQHLEYQLSHILQLNQEKICNILLKHSISKVKLNKFLNE